MFNVKFNKIVAAAAAVALSGCVNANSPQPQDEALSLTALAHKQAIAGSQGLQLDGQSWLLASESQGLVVVDESGQSIIKNGNFEGLSARKLGDNSYLIASMDNNQDDVALFKLSKGEHWQAQLIARVAPEQSQPEAMCLYNDINTGAISLFVADARGLINQTYVYDTRKNKAVNVPVREFAGLSESAGCTVVDSTHTLYLSEAEVGVWAINADAESRSDKKPLAMVEPFGRLATEIGTMATDAQGGVYFSTTSDALFYRYDSATTQWQSWQLPKNSAIEGVSIGEHAGLEALLYDDESGSYYLTQLDIELDKRAQPAKTTLATVTASAQTTPVQAFGDAADDPAIWVHPSDNSKSLILGTDKRRGVMVYNLAGELVQALKVGRVNNIDVRQHESINTPSNTLVAASNRTHNSISMFTVDAKQRLVALGDIGTNMREIYGLCSYISSSGHYVFANDKSGLFQQYRVQVKEGELQSKLVREFHLPSQPEGCAADDALGQLFAGEEDQGIWFIGAEPDAGEQAVMLQAVNEQLVDDVEGIDIYHGESERLLVVSSQGDHSYVLYRIAGDTQLPSLEFAHKFKVINDLSLGIDGASETDGLAVTAKALPGYPQGILVVQDGYNRMPQQPQNFKVVDWRDVIKSMQ